MIQQLRRLLRTRYRIVKEHNFAHHYSYVVQAWRPWFPLWVELQVNMNSSEERAMEWLRYHLESRRSPTVIAYVDPDTLR